MTMREEPAAHEAPLTSADLTADRKMEVLLGEALGSDSADPLPLDFTARLLAARPFAPWETRRPAVWKTPALVVGGLLLASMSVFALPLLRLGPGSALALWSWATLAALSRPAVAFVSALGLLPSAGSAVKDAIPGAGALYLGAGTLVSLAATALLARRSGRQAADAARG